MGKFKDITGEKYGKLLVLSRAESRNGATCWNCLCECGSIVIIRGAQLKNGHTQSCGCLRKEKLSKYNTEYKVKNLAGQRFGELTALFSTEERDCGQVVWMCQCSCGILHKVRGSLLTSGLIQSCGHQKSRGESKICQLLYEHEISFEKEKTFDTCRSSKGGLFRFDFWVDNKYLIEFDGIQHYQTTGLCDYEDTINRDEIKNYWCKENNIPLIRIPYFHLEKLTIEDLLLETSSFII